MKVTKLLSRVPTGIQDPSITQAGHFLLCPRRRLSSTHILSLGANRRELVLRHSVLMLFQPFLPDMKQMRRDSPRSLFFAFLGVGLALLASDFLFIYIPLSGWIVQSVLVGVYLEYLKPKKTLVMLAIMEVLFLASYGGSVTLALILGLVPTALILPVVVGLYFGLIAVVYVLGFLVNYFFHKIHLFERLSQRVSQTRPAESTSSL